MLHRFVREEWKILTSQTIGVEFASKIVSIGYGSRTKKIKLQLWDTAGTERFRSVSRSYYRGAAGAILVYDISSANSFRALPTFLHDLRQLASPQLTVILAGNKSDIADDYTGPAPASLASPSAPTSIAGSLRSTFSGDTFNLSNAYKNSMASATTAPEGREVYGDEAADWAQHQKINVATEVSALTGDSVDDAFTRLAKIILTRIELGEIDPSDPASGIQYGEPEGQTDSIRSGITARGGRPKRTASVSWASGLRDWEEVFRVDRHTRRRGCC